MIVAIDEAKTPVLEVSDAMRTLSLAYHVHGECDALCRFCAEENRLRERVRTEIYRGQMRSASP
jgi:hypothetical protein